MSQYAIRIFFHPFGLIESLISPIAMAGKSAMGRVRAENH
jgi:hypothetical protein